MEKAPLHCSWPFWNLGGSSHVHLGDIPWQELVTWKNDLMIYTLPRYNLHGFLACIQEHPELKDQNPYLHHHHLLFLPTHKPSCYITEEKLLDLMVVFLTRPCYPLAVTSHCLISGARGKLLCSVVPGFFPPAAPLFEAKYWVCPFSSV